jgi:hypothetical protein
MAQGLPTAIDMLPYVPRHLRTYSEVSATNISRKWMEPEGFPVTLFTVQSLRIASCQEDKDIDTWKQLAAYRTQ